MNSLIETAKHLTITSSETGPELSSADRKKHDQEQLISNFKQVPMTLQDFVLMPRIWYSGTISDLSVGAATQWACDLKTLTALFPNMLTYYRFARFHFRYTLVIKSAWSTTGLMALAWAPNIAAVDSVNTSGCNSDIRWVDKHTHAWYSSPTYRSIGRVGPDLKLTVDVPWISPYSSYLTDAKTKSPSPLSSDLLNSFTIYMVNLTALRTIATSVQTLDYVMYVQPFNIDVGGFVGRNVVNN